jgi:hypothetical protein
MHKLTLAQAGLKVSARSSRLTRVMGWIRRLRTEAPKVQRGNDEVADVSAEFDLEVHELERLRCPFQVVMYELVGQLECWPVPNLSGVALVGRMSGSRTRMEGETSARTRSRGSMAEDVGEQSGSTPP